MLPRHATPHIIVVAVVTVAIVVVTLLVVVVVGYCMFALLLVVLCTLYIVGLIVQAAATNGINTRNTSSSIFARTSFVTFSEIVFNDIKIAKITKATHTTTGALSLLPSLSLSLSLSLAHSLVGNQ